MNFHNITKDDMKNGDGLRVVLWVSGCSHHCAKCQNPQTWDASSGIEFKDCYLEEIYAELDKDYISGITFSGGDPLNNANYETIILLSRRIKMYYPNKTIWLYTGYTWEQIVSNNDWKVFLLPNVDVIVDGKFDYNLADVNYHWAGSTNQNVIDVQQSLKEGKMVLWKKS